MQSIESLMCVFRVKATTITSNARRSTPDLFNDDLVNVDRAKIDGQHTNLQQSRLGVCRLGSTMNATCFT